MLSARENVLFCSAHACAMVTTFSVSWEGVAIHYWCSVEVFDDIFRVWLHGKESLKQFHCSLNQFHPTIKFSLEHTDDTPSIPFLDTSVSITQDSTIATEFYIKTVEYSFTTVQPIPRQLKKL